MPTTEPASNEIEIEFLIEILNVQNQDTIKIRREIQAIAIDIRNEKNTAEKEKQEKKLTHLQIAHDFLIWLNKNPNEKSTEWHKPLSKFFASKDCTISGKERLSYQCMQLLGPITESDFSSVSTAAKVELEITADQIRSINDFRQKFNAQLKHEENPAGLISLASTYFDEPEKFTAFLLWLLEKGVSPKKIIDSKLLHNFFATQMPFLSDPNNALNQVYTELKKFNTEPGVQALLALAHDEFANARGVRINQVISKKGEIPKYQSDNLMGDMFEHSEKINETTTSISTLPPPCVFINKRKYSCSLSII